MGLNLTISKTTLIHFNNKNISPGIEIKINETHIKSTETVRFLGIILDYKLSFTRQIDKIVQKCTLTQNILKFLCGTWWGSDPDTLITIYKSYVRSLIDYGSFIFFPKTVKLSQKLEAIQNSSIRCALGYRKSTPLNVMLAESKLTTIKERTRYLCYKFLLKSLSNPDTATYNAIIRYYNICKKTVFKKERILNECIVDLFESEINNWLCNNNIYLENYNIISSSIDIDIEFGKKLKNSADPNHLLNSFLSKSGATALYTDGSKTDEAKHVGSASICPEFSKTKTNSILKYASIFTAECIAIHDALEIALDIGNTNFCILTDSMSALLSLQTPKYEIKTNPYIFKIKHKYTQFKTKFPHHDIKFCWIPAHSGIYGNELADSLAKSATQIDNLNITKIPFTDVFQKFKQNAHLETEKINIEKSRFKGTQFFSKFYSTSIHPWYRGKNLDRNLIVTVNRCRADHINLADSLARVNIVDNSICKCNLYNEDINHVVWQCSLYNTQRQKLLDNLKKLKLYPPLSIECIILKPDISACRYLISFLKNCRLKI